MFTPYPCYRYRLADGAVQSRKIQSAEEESEGWQAGYAFPGFNVPLTPQEPAPAQETAAEVVQEAAAEPVQEPAAEAEVVQEAAAEPVPETAKAPKQPKQPKQPNKTKSTE